jgi:aspartate aminotransferase, chloroplastic
VLLASVRSAMLLKPSHLTSSCSFRTLSQLKRIARASYSNPPVHGARIVAEVVNDSNMFDQWKAEMEMMSGRIKGVRQLLHDELKTLYPEKDWGFILSQIGMFSYTGSAPNSIFLITSWLASDLLVC